MVADNRFGYLDSVRFILSYTATPFYWVADMPARTSEFFDDVFVSRSDLLAEN